MPSLPEVPMEVVKLCYKTLHIDESKIGREMLKTFDIVEGHRGQALSIKIVGYQTGQGSQPVRLLQRRLCS